MKLMVMTMMMVKMMMMMMQRAWCRTCRCCEGCGDMDDVCQVDEAKIEKVGRTLFGKTAVAGTSGMLALQLANAFGKLVFENDCASQPVSRVGRTGQQTCFICCAFVQFL